VKDVFGTLGLNKPDLSLLDEQFLAQIQRLPTKNLAAELLERLIADQVKARGQKNAMQAKEFTDKLEEAIAKYQNRALTTVEVIEELIKLAKEINAAKPPEGLTEESSRSTRRCARTNRPCAKWATRCCAPWRRS
jgi:type I restriction enzyme R subunit